MSEKSPGPRAAAGWAALGLHTGQSRSAVALLLLEPPAGKGDSRGVWRLFPGSLAAPPVETQTGGGGALSVTAAGRYSSAAAKLVLMMLPEDPELGCCRGTSAETLLPFSV